MSVVEHKSAAEEIAADCIAALGSHRQIAPFSSGQKSFALDEAYRVTASVRHMREARGETIVGRKIGFTNRTIWAEYGVYAPIWGYVYNSTLHELSDVANGFSLADLSEPRIEPEIVFGLASAPRAGMDERELLSCIAWVAHGFEIVQSIFTDWKFAPADTVAAFGLHGALLIGERHQVSDAGQWLQSLPKFSIELACNGKAIDQGHASNVLDGPLSALRHLVGLLAADEHNPPLAAGEIITTGTLTRAMPVQSGEHWSTRLSGIALDGIRVRFR